MNQDSSRQLIGLDLGTSAVKGVLTDSRGQVLAEATAKTALLHPREGWIEVDPEDHYDRVCGVIRHLAESATGEVAALAMASASGNSLLADAQGTPLTPIINWMDERCKQSPPPALGGFDTACVHEIVGWPCVETFPLAHLAWLRDHCPQAYSAAAHVGMAADWLMHRLTGRWALDHSTATPLHLQDQVSGTYSKALLDRLGIPPSKLPDLLPSGRAVAELTAQAAKDTGLSTKTLLVSGSFDHPAAARATGVLEPGQLMLSCGTSWVGFMPFDRRDAIIEAGLLCDPFLSDGGGPWAGMFSVPTIGRTIDWYVSNRIAPEAESPMAVFDELAAQAPPGADGLSIDLREPPGPTDASRAAIARAVMEGAARLLAEKLAGLKAFGFVFDSAVLVGGPARSPVWPAIVEEGMGLTVSRGPATAGARGTAVLAGIGAGFYKDERDALDAARRPGEPPSAATKRCTPSDRAAYTDELRDILPERVFDSHAHLFDSACLKPGHVFPPKSCFRKFGGVFTREQYLEWAGALFPEHEFWVNSFGHPGAESDLDASAAYSGRISDNRRFFAMALVSPHDRADAVRRRVLDNRLIGYKPYLRFVDWKDPADVTIHDMLPADQMRVADELGLAVTLHIPRLERLADPVNQRQMVELCERYPNAPIIVAHIGRAYYLNNVRGFLDGIAACPNGYIDTAMVNHEGVLEYAFRHFPRERILFGSDAPIAFLRGKSVEINNQYAYLMAEDYEIGTSIHDANHAVEFTTFFHEQVRGIKLAAERAKLSSNEVEALFFDNARRLFAAVAERNYPATHPPDAADSPDQPQHHQSF